MNPRQLLRMAKWARNPPSEKLVILVFSVVAICLLIWGSELLFGWSEGLFSKFPSDYRP